MGELPKVTPEYFQILVVRELRKAGFEVGDVRLHRRSELPEPQRGFVLELTAPLTRAMAVGQKVTASSRLTSSPTSTIPARSTKKTSPRIW